MIDADRACSAPWRSSERLQIYHEVKATKPKDWVEPHVNIIFKIALRNTLRNSRRSAVTLSAICVGGIALLLFGTFIAQVILGFQTTTIQRVGHLTLFKAGYFEFGSGDPAAFGIPNSSKVMATLREDPILEPLLNAVTPAVNVVGIAGSPDNSASKSFVGLGVVPGERKRTRVWDEYRVMDAAWRSRMEQDSGLTDEDTTQSFIGVGLARLLGLCDRLGGCAAGQTGGVSIAAADQHPRINLLAAQIAGAPNIVTLAVNRTNLQGQKELDESFVAMHITAAQRLLFGPDQDKVSSIVVQLKRTESMGVARARLLELIGQRGLDLEIHDFADLTPLYSQAVALFRAIFGFIAVIMSVIVLFIVVNTMSMNVVERTNEIGVGRALGARRGGIRRQFLAEGLLLGMGGATVAVFAAALIGMAFNQLGLTWTPPGQAGAIPLQLLLRGSWPLFAGVWLGLTCVAMLGGLVPANRAARMVIVDALRRA